MAEWKEKAMLEAKRYKEILDQALEPEDYALALEKLELLHDIATSRIYSEDDELKLYTDLKSFLKSHDPELTKCAACNGSGWYDKTDRKGRSIKCGACGGTGRVK